ncbi:MAG: hypothetical protein WCK26_03290 [Candidatus Saccharibacteria bacterium]|jgi:hypothetical protein
MENPANNQPPKENSFFKKFNEFLERDAPETEIEPGPTQLTDQNKINFGDGLSESEINDALTSLDED